MSPEPARRRFATTRWTLVLAAAEGGSSDADAALATLCETYWPPVFAFVRRSGHVHEDARDLTQAFFTRLMERGYLKAANRDRGRFRSFLLAAVRHFLADARDHDVAIKRGGLIRHVAIDAPPNADGGGALQIATDDTPEQAFERSWARACFASAVSRVEAEYARAGKQTIFATLKPAIDGDEPLAIIPACRHRSSAARVRRASPCIDCAATWPPAFVPCWLTRSPTRVTWTTSCGF